jgi:methylglutaconyl-CoA hydratase
MAYGTLTVSHADAVATITFNRPDKRNAISHELIDELLRALGEVEQSSAQVLLLTGAGKAFCSGMDLDNLKSITGRTAEENLKDSQTMGLLFRSIYEFPRPTIAAVNGPAIAGGCGIATLCDFTLASTEAKFGYTEVRIGFLPAIVSTFLVRQIGEKRARDLLLTGRIVGAHEAFHIGLATEVVEAANLLTRAHELAAQLMENSPASMTATKQLLTGYSFEELNSNIRAAVDSNARIRATDDFREGVSSFLEKRRPKWSGK